MVSALVVAAWIFHGGKLLLISHRRTGRWLPVGGHVEPGEHALDALRREVMEEVGLRVEVLGSPPLLPVTAETEDLPLPFRVASHDGREGAELVLDFVAAADDISFFSIDEAEVVDYQWFSLPDLRSSRVVSDRVKRLGERAFSYSKELMGHGRIA